VEEAVTTEDTPIEEAPSEEEIRLNNRYAPLAIWLQKVPIEDERVSLSFRYIGELIGGELPTSARLYRIWWSNILKINPLARQWWDAGWRISTVRIAEETVVFTRIEGRKKHMLTSLARSSIN
jgi:hypothetical protein